MTRRALPPRSTFNQVMLNGAINVEKCTEMLDEQIASQDWAKTTNEGFTIVSTKALLLLPCNVKRRGGIFEA